MAGVRTRSQKSATWPRRGGLRTSGAGGSPHAQINLAYSYDSGAFGFVDRGRAKALNKWAFKQEYTQEAYNVAQTYRMDNERRWYIYWLRKAAKVGDTDAKAELRSLGVSAGIK